MKHFTEIEITEFVLSGRTTPAFEEHVRDCSGCRDLYGEIAEFHAHLHRQPLALPGETAGTVIDVRPEFVGDAPRLPGTRSLGRRFAGFVRQRPLAAGGTLFASGVLIAALFFFMQGRTTADLSYYRINTQTESIEVYSAEDDLLWSLPVGNAAGWQKADEEFGEHLASIADFNDDGRNDLIVIGRTGSDLNTGYQFKVYDRKKRLIREYTSLADAAVAFNGVRYNQAFYPVHLTKADISGKTHLFALSNNGRSPTFIIHFNEDGDVVGRYWHFGQLGYLATVDVDGDMVKELVGIGVNDMNFPRLTDGIAVVLDPEKIVGETESSATRGFGLTATSAERYYVKFPRSDLDDSLRLQSIPRGIKPAPSGFGLRVCSVLNEQFVLTFEYVFGPGMELVDVKGDDGSARIHELYVKKGLITSKYGKHYFDDLRRRLEYWDGVQWHTDRRAVQQGLMAEK